MTRMAKRIDSRQETKHAAYCGALRQVKLGNWDSPWAIGAHVFLTKLGTAGGPSSRGANTSWLRFRCNSCSCPATVVVRSSDVLSHVPHGEASR